MQLCQNGVMKIILKIAIITGAVALLSTDITAQTSNAANTEPSATSSFVKKRYNIKGTWSVTEKEGKNVITFHDDFKTKGGPDLKIYLSSKSLSELESADVESSSVKLSVLKSNRGAQSYILPEDVKLSDYKSVVIHCEAFSVLWGGFDIAKTP